MMNRMTDLRTNRNQSRQFSSKITFYKPIRNWKNSSNCNATKSYISIYNNRGVAIWRSFFKTLVYKLFDRCFSANTMPFILTFCYRRFPMHQSFLEQVLLMHCLEVSENKAKYLGLQNVIWSIHIYKDKWLQLEGFITTWDQACKIVFLKNILEIHFHRNRNTFLPITRLNLHWEGDLCD